jgi:hypothetical protein
MLLARIAVIQRFSSFEIAIGRWKADIRPRRLNFSVLLAPPNNIQNLLE